MIQNSNLIDEPIRRFEFEQSGPWSLDLALIRVPDVSRFGPRPIRAESWSGGFAVRRATPRPRPRRRLRREIRVTAYACLATLPLIIAAGIWSIHSTARRAGAAEIVPTTGESGSSSSRPLVWLSIEPAETAGVDAQPQPPVIFPGYLLPPDHREELSHEGS